MAGDRMAMIRQARFSKQPLSLSNLVIEANEVTMWPFSRR
jgi:hypothetical protein